MLVSLGLIILFSILLYFSDHKSFRFVLVMVGVVEIAISSYLMLDRIGMRSNIYSNYVTENQELFDHLPASVKSKRIAKNYFLNNDRGESYAFNYKGAEIFSSNNDPKISKLYANLGLSAYGYYYFYKTGTVVTDAIFNIGGFIDNSLPSQSISPEYISYGLRDDLKNNPILLKEKQYTAYRTDTLPLVFAGNLSNNLKFKSDDPVYNQNLVLNSLTQTQGNVLTYSPKVAKIKVTDSELNQEKKKFTVTRTSDKEGSVTFTFDGLKPKETAYVQFGKDLMGFADPLTTYHATQDRNNKPELSITINKKDVRLQPQVKQLIGVRANQKGQVQIKWSLAGNKRILTSEIPRLVNINSTLLRSKVSQVNNKKQMHLTTFRDNYLSGKINTTKNENLVTTIPYSRGWKVKVDGKPVKVSRTLNVFIGLNMKPGKHTVVMRYRTPGLLIGVITSIIGIILLVVFNGYLEKKKY